MTEIYLVIAILCAFTCAAYRAKEKDVSFKTFLWVIVDFVFFPMVVTYELISKGKYNRS